MNRQKLPQQMIGMVVASLFLVGCALSSEATPTKTLRPTFTDTPVHTPMPTDTPTPEFLPTPVPIATPTSCTGWRCTLRGVVYVNAAGSGNELKDVLVKLSQSSYCSPTSGQHETTTGPDGTFEFDVYIHDTDTFWIRVELDGYEPASQSLGGFDCLYCSCPPVEIVLQPLDTSTSTPIAGMLSRVGHVFTQYPERY
jgi:hypothetical protein